MKLYDVKRGQYFKVISEEVIITPPDSLTPNKEKVYKYTHIDGMYAPVIDLDGDVYYIAAWTDVEVVNAPS